MKNRIASFVLALLTASPLAGFGQANLKEDPAYLPIDGVLDLKSIRPEVNVNLPHFLLKDALSELKGEGTNAAQLDGLDLADLTKDIKLIRVVVIEANATNRPALDKAVKSLRDELDRKWTTIVSVPENNVGVYAMSDPAGDATAGLAILVFDGDNAVIGNIVGHVAIGKLIQIASKSGKFPKDLLKKLQSVGGQGKESSATAPADGSNADSGGAKTKPPGEAQPAK